LPAEDNPSGLETGGIEGAVAPAGVLGTNEPIVKGQAASARR